MCHLLLNYTCSTELCENVLVKNFLSVLLSVTCSFDQLHSLTLSYHVVFTRNFESSRPSPVLKCFKQDKKTKCMAVKPDCLKDLHVPNFYIEGSRLTEVKTKDQLGYIITEDFADDQPINKEIRSVYVRGNMLDRKFKFCSGEVKRRLFISCCTSLYCCSLWCCFNPNSLLKLKVAHNNILRQFYKLQGGPGTSISHHFVTMDIPNLDVIRRLVYSLYSRVFSSPNIIVTSIVNSMYFRESIMFNEWLKVLF